jgi:hypothetical protein
VKGQAFRHIDGRLAFAGRRNFDEPHEGSGGKDSRDLLAGHRRSDAFPRSVPFKRPLFDLTSV